MFMHVQLINEIVPDEPDPAAANALQEGVALFNPASTPITRYRYRGTTIPSPWTYATTVRRQ